MQMQLSGVDPKAIGWCRAGAAGVFPLGLAGQGIFPAGGKVPRARSRSVKRRQNSMASIQEIFSTGVCGSAGRERAGLAAHDGFPLGLRHFILA